MKIRNAELITSAVKKNQYPESNKPEFVLLGRSNVGKSTFINTLINRKNLARTSSQPGKTQTMNFYNINSVNGEFIFVDMPGYGYAKVSKKERAKWGQMIEEYLLNRETIKEVFLLIDSRVGPTEDDILMFEWLKYYDLNPIIIATKADKLKSSIFDQSIKKIKDTLKLEEKDTLIPFSAKRLGFEEAWNRINQHLEID